MAETKLQDVKLTAIDFGDRIREDYGDLEALAQSIDANGLISPIALRLNPAHAEDKTAKKYILVAGGRRLTAFLMLRTKFPADPRFGHIASSVYDATLTEEEALSLEYVENFQRADMSWLEYVKTAKKLHDRLVALKGAKIARVSGDEGHSTEDTAQMLGIHVTTLREDMHLADALIAYPEMADCKTKAEAHRYRLERQRQIKNNLAQTKFIEDQNKEAKAQGIPVESSPHKLFVPGNTVDAVNSGNVWRMDPTILTGEALELYEKKIKTLRDIRTSTLFPFYCIGDAFAQIRLEPDNTYDLIEIDPPYGIGLKTLKKSSSNVTVALEEYNEIEPEDYIALMAPFFKECFRVLKPNGWIIFWHLLTPHWAAVWNAIEEAGFEGKPYPAIWSKTAGQTNSPEKYLGSCYESFFYARKGDASIARKSMGRLNNFVFPGIQHQHKKHPTERPIEMIQEVMACFLPDNYTEPRNILIPFLGSGNSILAAANLRCRSKGWDLSQTFKDYFFTFLQSPHQKAEFSSYWYRALTEEQKNGTTGHTISE